MSEPAVDVDVVVAGAGGAGTAAALAAAERGLEVLLLEGNVSYRVDSNTAMSTAMVPAAGSRWQREAGVDDEPARFLADIMRKTGGSASMELSRALTGVAPELVDWLADRWDVPLGLVTDFDYPGHSVPRCHAVPDRAGATLLGHLSRAADGLAAVNVGVPLTLKQVHTDERGAVAAVDVVSPGGDPERIRTGAVVLATNGFAADPDLVDRYLPEIAGATYFGSPGSRGDALRIGHMLGADTDFLDAYQGHGSLAVPHQILLTWAAVMHGGVIVNLEGKRFGDETVGYSEYAAVVNAQPGGAAWVVFDEAIHELLHPFKDYQDVLRASAARHADDVAALAAVVGCTAETLDRTLASADAARRGAADAFGRSRWGARLSAPYVAVRVTGALFHTQGGLVVDDHARVLADGAPIPGLYAAGGAAHGISGRGASGYLAGNGLLAALGLGYLAGRAIPT